MAMSYRLLRPLLFALEAERSHELVLGALSAISRHPGLCRLLTRCYAPPPLPCTLMGLSCSSPLGLAAGLDKQARAAPALAALGFGFLELGTVTPRPQPGNPRPRLFRLVKDEAIINRMGFNSVGLDVFLEHRRRFSVPCPVGINIGKNADTSLDRAVGDYLTAFERVYAHADYIAVNISSPNTPQLRSLQSGAALDELLGTLKTAQARLAARTNRRVPLAVKIAPDLDDPDTDAIGECLLRHSVDGVIATNTMVGRPASLRSPLARETGGLSGRPLRAQANAVGARLYRTLRGRVPIIGAGGIASAADAVERIRAGADALQVYTSFIYRGPAIIGEIVGGLARSPRAGQSAEFDRIRQQLRTAQTQA
jgi:dihydroorotate dehydrogenase